MAALAVVACFLPLHAKALSTAAPQPKWVTLFACADFEANSTRLTADAQRRVNTLLVNGRADANSEKRLMVFTGRAKSTVPLDDGLTARRISKIRESLFSGYSSFAVDILPRDSAGLPFGWLGKACNPDAFLVVHDSRGFSTPAVCQAFEQNSCELMCNFISCDFLRQ